MVGLGGKYEDLLPDKSLKKGSIFVGNAYHTKNKYRLQSVELW